MKESVNESPPALEVNHILMHSPGRASILQSAATRPNSNKKQASEESEAWDKQPENNNSHHLHTVSTYPLRTFENRSEVSPGVIKNTRRRVAECS